MVFFGFCLAAGLSILISKNLAGVISSDMKKRELEILFGALESGPLAIARLQSAEISQQELTNLMAHPNLIARGILRVKLEGGPATKFKFAEWTSNVDTDSSCFETITRKYEYVDALNPFQLSVTRNKCFVPLEERTIFSYSNVASLLILIVSVFLLLAATWPASASIRKAEKIILLGLTDAVHEIAYEPIRDLVQKSLRNIEVEKQAALAKIAKQVAHDIRAPLMALETALLNAVGLPAERRDLISKASLRIKMIAEDLLSKSKHPLIESSLTTAHISLNESIKNIVREKGLLFPNAKIEVEGLVSDIQILAHQNDFERLLSNLMQNSIEAVANCHDPRVQLSLRHYQDQVQIVIMDNGIGIPSDVISKIGEDGFSFGKSNGHGLGVHFAKNKVREWGGKFNISSHVGIGTLVTLSFPSHQLPLSLAFENAT